MTEWDVSLTALPACEAVRTAVGDCAESLGLQITLEGTLRSYPGSLHWHLKRGAERGVVEVSFWPRAGRLWVSVQAGRAGAWTSAGAADLLVCLGRRLSGGGD